MEQTDINNPVWAKLILNEIQPSLNFLAAKILLSHLRMKIKYNNDNIELKKSVQEIFDLYYKNKILPSAQKDISLLLIK